MNNSYFRPSLARYSSSIFSEMSTLAAMYQAVNLGQGFPDQDGPSQVIAAASKALESGFNQYAPARGVSYLREMISQHQRIYYDLDYDPDAEIVVTAGATEAVAATILGLCSAGDEVILFEPYYDSYGASVAIAGAKIRAVRLHGDDFKFDREELENAFRSRTKALVVNSPHNPSGTTLSREDLQFIANLCIANDVVVISDEVYEHLIYGDRHLSISTLPNMRERTVVVSSAAKTYSLTGWKVGWVCAPRELIDGVLSVKQYLTFANATPLQHGIAFALSGLDEFIDPLVLELESKRELLRNGLSEVGFRVLPSNSTYFLTTDVSQVSELSGIDFAYELPKRYQVAVIPYGVFYNEIDHRSTLIRWSFCKSVTVLERAMDSLSKLKDG